MATCVIGASLPRSAEAQRAGEYDQLVEEALEEFWAGRYREAISVFHAALEHRESARVFRGIGKAYFELGEYVDALRSLERSLATELDPLTDDLRRDVEELIGRARRHVATLEIQTRPEDAEVSVDGRLAEGSTVRVSAGEHTITVRAPGHETAERSVRIAGGQSESVRVWLSPSTGGSSLLAVSAGVGVAALGGLTGSILWTRDRSDALDACQSALRAGIRCTNEDRLISERRVALSTLAISGALTAASLAGLILWARQRRGEDTQAACILGPDGGQCVAGVRF